MKEPLTKTQREIYNDLTVEHRTVREIARRRNVSLQAVYSQLQIIARKGWIRKEYTANYIEV